MSALVFIAGEPPHPFKDDALAATFCDAVTATGRRVDVCFADGRVFDWADDVKRLAAIDDILVRVEPSTTHAGARTSVLASS